MKKIFSLVALLIAFQSFGQLENVTANLTLRKIEWLWAAGAYGEAKDSATAARFRAIRTAIIAANPATDDTPVTINNVNGKIIFKIFELWLAEDAGVILRLGDTNAERFNVYTTINAINNATLQANITRAVNTDYEAKKNKIVSDGKSLVFDN